MANDHDPKKPVPGFEESDVNVFAIGRFAFALVAVVLVCVVLLFGFFHYLVGVTGGPRPKVSDYSRDGQLPPQPRLEERPVTELREFREAEDKALNSYGWVDQKAGVVRIPIERAMQLIAQQGLPTTPKAGTIARAPW